MKKIVFWTLIGLLLSLAVACGSSAPPAPTEAPVEPTEVPAEPTDPPPTEEPTEIPTEIPTEEPTEAPAEPTEEPTVEPEPVAYDGPITEIAIRRVATDLTEFVDVREAYIDILSSQDGIAVDREFRAFLDFSTFGAPAPAVYIGMTEYDSPAAFEQASGAAGSTDAAAAFFSSFDLEIFGALRPVNAANRYDLADMAIEPGQVLEVAARDLSTYSDFDQVAYEASRDTFLEALSQQPGFVREYQWVSILDENIAVGMTVYESVEAYVGINTSDFVNTPEYTDFVATYPFVVGYANFDAKPAGLSALDLGSSIQFPESVAVNGQTAYVSNFFDGSIHSVDLNTGENSVLVESGTDGVAAGWGLWYDNASETLFACTARNPFAGPFDNLNAVKSIDPATGETLEIWDLPAGALCNSLVVVTNGDIYVSDVSPSADIIRIDRAAGVAEVWVDEPAWENDSGFGLGGLAWDGGENLYVSVGGPLVRFTISDTGEAGEGVVQTLLAPDGSALPALAFDGFTYSEESGTFYGAAFDFNSFQSRVVGLTPLDGETVQTGTALAGVLGVTGLDADGGSVYAVDGQIIQALFVEGYAPPAPFPLMTLVEQ